MHARGADLCALDDLADPGTRAFTVHSAGGVRDIFLVRRGAAVYAYVNSCPHTRGPLDWVPGRFLDMDGHFLQCSTHDARFRIEDGECVAGPCAGDRLTAVPVRVAAGRVVLASGEIVLG